MVHCPTPMVQLVESGPERAHFGCRGHRAAAFHSDTLLASIHCGTSDGAGLPECDRCGEGAFVHDAPEQLVGQTQHG